MRIEDTLLMKKKMEGFIKKEIKDATKEEVDLFLKDIISKSTYTTARSYISIAKHVLKQECNEMELSLANYETNQTIKGIYNKEDVESMLKELINYQDRFIILAIYNGIIEDGFKELLELKTKNIDIEKGIIKTSRKIVIMDELFKEIAKKTMAQDTYEIIDNNGDIKYYEMNMKSEYFIKTRPQARNNNGCNPMSREGLKSRFKKSMQACGCNATITTLEKSGYLNKMKEIKNDWTVAEVRSWLKENSIKLEGYNLLRTFNKFYQN